MQSGDNVYLRGGTHTLLAIDWTNVTNVNLSAYPGEKPILDGQYLLGEFAVFRDGVSNITLTGLQIQHYDNGIGNGAIVGVGNVSNIVIQDSVFEGNGSDSLIDHDIYLGGGSARGRLSNWTIRRNNFRNPRAGAVHSYGTNGAQNVIVEGNRISGGRWGVYISDEGQANWTVRNNIIIGAKEGIALGGETRGIRANTTGLVIVGNTVVARTGGVALRVDQPHIVAKSLVDLGNTFWVDGGGPPISWGYYGPNSRLMRLAEYKLVSGTGGLSIEANPGIFLS